MLPARSALCTMTKNTLDTQEDISSLFTIKVWRLQLLVSLGASSCLGGSRNSTFYDFDPVVAISVWFSPWDGCRRTKWQSLQLPYPKQVGLCCITATHGSNVALRTFGLAPDQPNATHHHRPNARSCPPDLPKRLQGACFQEPRVEKE